MSKQKTARKKKNRRPQSVASSAVGMIINVVVIVVAVMLIYRFSISAYRYGVRIFGEPPVSAAPGTEITITISDGKDFDQIADIIYQNGLVRDRNLFRLQERLSNYSEDGFMEGTYILTTAMTAEEMMDVMAGSGKQ